MSSFYFVCAEHHLFLTLSQGGPNQEVRIENKKKDSRDGTAKFKQHLIWKKIPPLYKNTKGALCVAKNYLLLFK